MSITKELLLSNNYWVLNKTLVKMLGIESAFLLSNFAEAEVMMADENGWFYQTSDTVEEMTTLSRYKQDRAVSKLEEMGILEKEIRGMPAKRYFKINYDRVTNLFVKNQQTSLSKTNKLVCKKLTTNKEHIYKESNKEHIQEKESQTDLDFDYIISLYSKHCSKLPQVRKLTQSRKTTLRNWNDINEMEEVFKLVGESDFLLGLDSYGRQTGDWVATFDWIIAPKNRLKILEGNYKNKGGRREKVRGYDFSDEVI